METDSSSERRDGGDAGKEVRPSIAPTKVAGRTANSHGWPRPRKDKLKSAADACWKVIGGLEELDPWTTYGAPALLVDGVESSRDFKRIADGLDPSTSVGASPLLTLGGMSQQIEQHHDLLAILQRIADNLGRCLKPEALGAQSQAQCGDPPRQSRGLVWEFDPKPLPDPEKRRQTAYDHLHDERAAERACSMISLTLMRARNAHQYGHPGPRKGRLKSILQWLRRLRRHLEDLDPGTVFGASDLPNPDDVQRLRTAHQELSKILCQVENAFERTLQSGEPLAAGAPKTQDALNDLIQGLATIWAAAKDGNAPRNVSQKRGEFGGFALGVLTGLYREAKITTALRRFSEAQRAT